MLRYQELVSSGLEPHEPTHPRSAIEDFCEQLGKSKFPDIRAIVAIMVHSILRVSIASARDDLADFIRNTVNMEAYCDSQDQTTDAFWSRYIKKGMDAAIRETIGNGDANASYKGRLVPRFIRGEMLYNFKANVDGDIRNRTLRACLLDSPDIEFRIVPFNAMLAFARLVDCQSLQEQVQTHTPADSGFRFMPTTRRILHCHAIPEWSFDLQGWSASLCQWKTTALRPGELFELGKEYNVRQILSWEQDFAKWRGNRSAFMLGRLGNRAVIFHSAERDWFHVCTTQQLEYLDRGQLIETMHHTPSSKRKFEGGWNGGKRPALRR